MEVLVLGDRPVLAVAKEFGISHDALQRHVNAGHISKELEESTVKKRANDFAALLEEILEISISSAKAAKQAGDYRGVGSCLQGPYKAAEILAKGHEGENEKSGLDSMREELKAMRAARQQPTEAPNVEDTPS